MLLLITFLRKEYALEQALFSRQKCFFLVRVPLLEPNFDFFPSWVQQAESHGGGGVFLALKSALHSCADLDQIPNCWELRDNQFF